MNNSLTHTRGWLSAYQRGYLHRDISIGNLLKLMKPARCKRFSALEVIGLLFNILSSEQQKELDNLEDWNYETAFRFVANDPERQELLRIAQDLDIIVDQCGLTTECKAIFTDGDMAAYIPDYFENTSVHNTGAISVSFAIHL